MKSIICLILCAIVAFSITACTLQNGTIESINELSTEKIDNDANVNNSGQNITESSCLESENANTEVENSHVIIANSVEDFISQFSDKSSQTTNHDIIFQAINNKKLAFEKYAIQSICYVPHQDEYGKLSGNLSLDLYWHENECTSCADYCEKFRLHLIYQKDGIDEAAATKGYSQTETKDFFIKEISNNKTAYVFLINSQYYCRYVVNNSIIDKEAVVEQLKTFCLEFSDMIRPDEHKS